MTTFDEYQDILNVGSTRDEFEQLLKIDVSHLVGEMRSLRSRFAGVDDQPAIQTDEPFEGMTHAEILAMVEGIQSDNVNSVANVWRNQSLQVANAAETFNSKVKRAIEDNWSGTSATAAANGVAGFVETFEDLPVAMTITANGLDTFETKLAYAKAHVPKLPTGVVEPADYDPTRDASYTKYLTAVDELEKQAQRAMASVYRPGVEAIDMTTTLLPSSVNPVVGGQAGDTRSSNVDGSGGNSGTGGSFGTNGGGGSSGSTGTGGSIGSSSGSGSQDQLTETQTGTNLIDDGSAVQSDDPTFQAASMPRGAYDNESVMPRSWLEDPIGRSSDSGTRNNSGVAGALPGAATASGIPGTQGRNVSPIVGRGAEATGVTSPRAGSSGTTSGRAGTNGMSGMSPAAARSRDGEDNDHKTPSYLVNVDNGNELIGPIRKVAPPVIGA